MPYSHNKRKTNQMDNEQEKLNRAVDGLIKDVVEEMKPFCDKHPETAPIIHHDEINNMDDKACPECIKEEDAQDALEEEQQNTRIRFKTEVTQNVADKLYKIMDDEVSPYMDILAYPDLVDIMVGIMQSNCMMMLEQISSMRQEDAFYTIKQRWYLVGMEFLKSMAKKKYNEQDIPKDEAMEAQIALFEKAERKRNEEAGVACSTVDCIHKVEEGMTQCLSCLDVNDGK